MRMTPSALVLLPKISIIRLTRSNPPWPHGTWDRFSTGHHWPWPRATLRPMAVVARWLLVCRGTVRHAAAQPASEPVKSRTNRYRLTLRALFRYQSSGLLIRGFGVQVPGGAPVMSWAFSTGSRVPNVRFMAVSGPWLLHVCSPVQILYMAVITAHGSLTERDRDGVAKVGAPRGRFHPSRASISAIRHHQRRPAAKLPARGS
jgi:hypothetical protein